MSIIHIKLEFECGCWSWCASQQKAYFRSESDNAGITTIYFKNCSMLSESILGSFNEEELGKLKHFMKEFLT